MALYVQARHWLIWPNGATEWMLTYSEVLAEKARKKGWGCVEYHAVPEEPNSATVLQNLRINGEM